LKKISIAIIIFLFLIFIIPAVFITIEGLNDDCIKADAIVVLGNKVNSDGTPSARLKARLDKALELYQQGLSKNIVVSGGTGIEGFCEAKVMADYLTSNGVPDSLIIQDSLGVTTRMTTVNCKQIFKKQKWQSVIVVSQFYHLSRSKLAFKQVGFKEISSAHAKYWEVRDFYSLAREVAGYFDYWIKY